MFGFGKDKEGHVSYCTHYYTSIYKGNTIEVIYMDNHTVRLEINGNEYGSKKDSFTGLSTEDIGAQVFLDGEERFVVVKIGGATPKLYIDNEEIQMLRRTN
jgi:hypothetical protein